MLSDIDVVATIAVSDIEEARRFYEGKLGLKGKETGESDVLTYKTGKSNLFVYASDYAGSCEVTTATWPVGDKLDDIVHRLQEKGIKFEHYDMPDTVREGDIHISGDMRMAWFKDPDGNIIGLVGYSPRG